MSRAGSNCASLRRCLARRVRNKSREVETETDHLSGLSRDGDRFFSFSSALIHSRQINQRGCDMAYTVKKADVWAGEIADRPGGLASTLAALQQAGSNIEFVVARRAPDKPGTGVVFLTPIKGSKQKTAAQQAGLGTSASLQSVRVEGPDRAGLGAKMADALAA